MKKVALIIIAIILITAVGCSLDPYKGVRPSDLGQAKWTSQNPSAFFKVDAESEDKDTLSGEIVVDGKTLRMELKFQSGSNGVLIIAFDNDKYVGELHGNCEYTKEKMVVKVNSEVDSLFNGSYKEITFVKGPLNS